MIQLVCFTSILEQREFVRHLLPPLPLLRITYEEQIPTLSNRVKGDRNDHNSTFLNSKAFYCYDIGTSGYSVFLFLGDHIPGRSHAGA